MHACFPYHILQLLHLFAAGVALFDLHTEISIEARHGLSIPSSLLLKTLKLETRGGEMKVR